MTSQAAVLSRTAPPAPSLVRSRLPGGGEPTPTTGI
jgi:hypothetical protein